MSDINIDARLREECDLHEMIGCLVCTPRPRPPVQQRPRRYNTNQVIAVLREAGGRWMTSDSIWCATDIEDEPTVWNALRFLERVYEAVVTDPDNRRACLAETFFYDEHVRNVGTTHDWPNEGWRC